MAAIAAETARGARASGDVVSGVVVSGNGTLVVSGGAFADETVVSGDTGSFASAGINVLSGGMTTSTLITDSFGGVSGGYETVYAGGVASGTVVYVSGTQYVSASGSAFDVHLFVHPRLGCACRYCAWKYKVPGARGVVSER